MTLRAFRFLPFSVLLGIGSGLFSCARIPPQSVVLAETIRSEGQRMHTLNRQMLGTLFRSKRMAIDSFIQTTYVPTLVENTLKKLKDRGTPLDPKDLPEFITDLMPVVSARRDLMVDALEEQQNKLLQKMDEDFLMYESACLELKNLLGSAAQVNASREQAFQRLNQLSNNRLNLNQVEGALDSFILEAGKRAETVQIIDGQIKALGQKIDGLINPVKTP